MGNEIQLRGRARRHGDLMRAFRPADVFRGRRVERLFDTSGRVRAERATEWGGTQYQLEPGGMADRWIPAAVGLFCMILPLTFVLSVVLTAYYARSLGVALLLVVWGAIFGIEGVLLSIGLGAIWCLLLMLAALFFGPVGAIGVVVIAAALVGIGAARTL